MKAYKLTGFAPDFCEQCMMTVADIYTTKELALQELGKMKMHIIEELQASGAAEEAMTHFSTDETQYYGGTRFIASCTINVMCNPKQQKHREMLFDFSGFSRSSLRATEVNFDTTNVTYKIAQLTITEEDINL